MKLINDRRRMRGQGGFTLIELLVVIAILGVLAGVVVFSVNGLTGRGEEEACRIERRTISTAAEAFRAEDAAGKYPTGFGQLTGQFLDAEPESGRWSVTWSADDPPGITPVVNGPCDFP